MSKHEQMQSDSKRPKCPQCKVVLDDFILSERARCHKCGADAGEMISTLEKQIDAFRKEATVEAKAWLDALPKEGEGKDG